MIYIVLANLHSVLCGERFDPYCRSTVTAARLVAVAVGNGSSHLVSIDANLVVTPTSPALRDAAARRFCSLTLMSSCSLALKHVVTGP